MKQTTGATLDPMVLRRLKEIQRRQARKLARVQKREARGQSYPYCGTRQRRRYARQIACGQLTVSNGLVLAS